MSFLTFSDSLLAPMQVTRFGNSLSTLPTKCDGLSPLKKMLQSSANNIRSHLVDTSDKSLMCNRNNMGPRMESHWTPQTLVLWGDLWFCHDTSCLWSWRFAIGLLWALPHMLCYCSFYKRIEGFAESKAHLRGCPVWGMLNIRTRDWI